MATFSSRNVSSAVLPVARHRIWQLVSDPVALAHLTPLVDHIEVDGDTWCWTLTGIAALGVSIAPSFTERMRFVPEERIEFRHEPPGPERRERAGAEGVYLLDSLGDTSTRLDIDITLCVELPLPGFARGAVERVMAATMQRTGDAFAANLYARLGVDPATVTVS